MAFKVVSKNYFLLEAPLKTGETVQEGDCIFLDGATGEVMLATGGGGKIQGVAVGTYEQGGTTYVKYVPNVPGLVFQAEISGAYQNVGVPVEITGGSGAQKINTAGITSPQVVIIGLAPGAEAEDNTTVWCLLLSIS